MGGVDPARELRRSRAMRSRQARRHRQQAAAQPARRGAVGGGARARRRSCASRPRSPASCPSSASSQESLAGAHVDRVHGIVNGTTNFILTRDGRAPAPRTRRRWPRPRSSGYAEADPTEDVTGGTPPRRWRSSPGSPSARRCTSTRSPTRASSTSPPTTWSTPSEFGLGAQAASAPPSASDGGHRGARAPGVPLRRPSAGERQRPVQRRHDRVAGDHRDHAVRARAPAARRRRARSSATSSAR